MSDNIQEARYAFNALLVDKLNSVVEQLPTDVPYTISHFYLASPGDIYCQLADDRTALLTYVTLPNLVNNTFDVVAYFEASSVTDPITVVDMDVQMLGLYQLFVDVFIETAINDLS